MIRTDKDRKLKSEIIERDDEAKNKRGALIIQEHRSDRESAEAWATGNRKMTAAKKAGFSWVHDLEGNSK